MRCSLYLPLACLALLTLGFTAWGEEPATQSNEKLLELLQNGNFDERQDAERTLLGRGDAVRPLLEQTIRTTDDLDVRAAISRILENMYQSSLLVDLYDRDAQPLATQKVILYSTNAQVVIRAGNNGQKSYETNESGRISITGLKPGLQSLNFQLPELDQYPNYRQYWLRTGINRILMVASRRGTISGVIVDGATGKPLENAEIKLIPDNGYAPFGQDWQGIKDWGGVPTTSTKANGEFTIEKVPLTPHLLFINHDDFQLAEPLTVRASEGEDVKLDAPIKLTAKSQLQGTLKIKLLGTDGKPFAKSKVGIKLIKIGDDTGLTINEMMQRGMIRNRMMGRGNPLDQETTEDGTLELKYTPPGTYRISLEPETGATLELSNVEIKAGVTKELDKQQFPAGGMIMGEIKNDQGKGVEYMRVFALRSDDPLAQAIASDPDASLGYVYMLQNRGNKPNQQQNMNTNKDGHFEIKELSPGSYFIICQGFDNHARFWFQSVEKSTVKDNETLDYGTLTVKQDQATGGENFDIKGQVVLPDGTPAQNVNVNMTFGNGSWGTRSGQNGQFQFAQRNSQQGKPDRIIFTLAGYKVQTVDLKARKSEWNNLTVKMEKLEYGSLTIKLTDPSGKPLANALLTPAGKPVRNNYYYRGNPVTPPPSTNAEGIARIKGLAPGKRSFKVQLDGYYLEKNLDLTIEANKELNLEVALKPGLELSGTLELPAGSKPELAMVTATGLDPIDPRIGVSSCRVATVDAQGHFSFTGLPAEPVELSATYPGLVAERSATPFSPPLKTATLKMQKAGGLKLDLGLSGRHAVLNWGQTEADILDSFFMASDTSMLQQRKKSGEAGGTNCDRNGKLEVFGLQPGFMNLLLSQGGLSRQMNRNGLSATAMFSLNKVEVKSVDGGLKGFKTVPYAKVDVPNFNASGHGKIAFKNAEKLADSIQNGQLQIMLAGPQGLAQLYYPLNQRNQYQRLAIIIGQPPAGCKLPEENRDVIRFTNLPAGEYKVYGRLQYWNIGQSENMQFVLNEKDKPLKTITLNADQDVDLGTLTFEIPQAFFDKYEALRTGTSSGDMVNAGQEDEQQAGQPAF